jgi:hypothetical protein
MALSLAADAASCQSLRAREAQAVRIYGQTIDLVWLNRHPLQIDHDLIEPLLWQHPGMRLRFDHLGWNTSHRIAMTSTAVRPPA